MRKTIPFLLATLFLSTFLSVSSAKGGSVHEYDRAVLPDEEKGTMTPVRKDVMDRASNGLGAQIVRRASMLRTPKSMFEPAKFAVTGSRQIMDIGRSKLSEKETERVGCGAPMPVMMETERRMTVVFFSDAERAVTPKSMFDPVQFAAGGGSPVKTGGRFIDCSPMKAKGQEAGIGEGRKSMFDPVQFAAGGGSPVKTGGPLVSFGEAAGDALLQPAKFMVTTTNPPKLLQQFAIRDEVCRRVWHDLEGEYSKGYCFGFGAFRVISETPALVRLVPAVFARLQTLVSSKAALAAAVTVLPAALNAEDKSVDHLDCEDEGSSISCQGERTHVVFAGINTACTRDRDGALSCAE